MKMENPQVKTVRRRKGLRLSGELSVVMQGAMIMVGEKRMLR